MVCRRQASQTMCPNRVWSAILGRSHGGSSASRPEEVYWSGAYSRPGWAVKPRMRRLDLAEERLKGPVGTGLSRDRLPQGGDPDLTTARRAGEHWAGRSRLIALEVRTTEPLALSAMGAAGGLTLARFRSFLPPEVANTLASASAARSLSSFVTLA